MTPPQSVLIVDESAELREVLRTALERSGRRILEAAEPTQGLEIARRDHPDLIVLDLEAETLGTDALATQFGETAQQQSTPIVVLATARRQATGVPTGQFVAKPYHYGPLIAKIESLLTSEC